MQMTSKSESTALTEAREERQNEEKHLNRLTLRLARAQTEENSLEINQYHHLLLESHNRLDFLREKERLAAEAFAGRGHQVEEKRTRIVEAATAQRERFHGWIGQLRDAATSGKNLDDGKGWTYEDPRPLFFEQLFLLADLMKGRPPVGPEPIHRSVKLCAVSSGSMSLQPAPIRRPALNLPAPQVLSKQQSCGTSP